MHCRFVDWANADRRGRHCAATERMSGLAEFLGSITQLLSSPPSDSTCMQIVSKITEDGLSSLNAAWESPSASDGSVDLRLVSLSAAALDVVLSIGVVPMLGNGIVFRFIPSGSCPVLSDAMEDVAATPALLEAFLGSRRVVSSLKIDVSQLSACIVSALLEDIAFQRALTVCTPHCLGPRCCCD